VDKYGWNFVAQLQQQNVTLVRSTEYPYDIVAAGRLPFAMFSEGEFNPSDGSSTRFTIPKNDPFVTWPQTAAIFKNATHPEAAKLYLNWLLDKQTQAGTWSVRKDVPPPTGWKSVWEYKNTDPTAFGKFMNDREAIERFRVQMSLIFGEVRGVCPTGQLGTHPTEPIQPFLDPFHSSLPSCQA
jgi:ABC-type Fe3+ transport system substrate-binding protein